MKKITASAPGKLMLSVGYAVVHGYPTIVTAVDQRLYVTIEKNGVDIFHLNAPDLGLSSYTKNMADLGKKDLPKSVVFIEILYRNFLRKYPQKEGIKVTTKSDFSSTYGFGSSSAVTVAFAKALTKLYGLNLSEKELFDLCFEAVIDVQGVGSGFDLASAIWGGTIYYVSPAKIVRKVNLSELPLMVVYSKEKADTPTLIRMVDNMYLHEKEKIEKIFKKIAKVADDFAKFAETKDWRKLGSLFNKSQEQARALNVSTKKLDEIVEIALKNGAYGATSSGAAGGDCILILADDKSQSAIKKDSETAGFKVLDVSINAEGARYEKLEQVK